MSARTDELDKIAAALGVLYALELVPPPSSVTSLKAGQSLQAAIDAAKAGDVLELEAGATWLGNYVLHGQFAQAVTIRSAGSYGPDRVSPATAAGFAKVKASAGGLPAFATAPGTAGFILNCLEVPGSGVGDVIQLGDGSTAQKTLDGIPSRLILDRCYIHGDVAGQKRGVALNSADTIIDRCYISGLFVKGQDSQAICGWNGPGPYHITDSFLEAASENVLFGGADPSVPNLVPSDIVIDGCTLSKQLAWKGKGFNVKNLFELKNARRVTFTNNRVSTVWGDAQVGYAVQLTPRNQDGTAPWSTVEDVLIQGNTFSDMAAAINFLGTDDAKSSGQMSRIKVLSNTFVNVDPVTFSGSSKIFQVSDGPVDLTIDLNIVTGANQIGANSSALYFASGRKALRMVFTGNTYPKTDYGIFGGGSSFGGNPPHAWVDYVDGGTLSGNVEI